MEAAALANYYAKRAPEYERIYQKPERQDDLAALHALVQQTFARKRVLELACGTGYWTETLARSADSVTAVDLNDEVLQIARAKPGNALVRFHRADVYDLPNLGRFNAALVAFWWSHMPKSRITNFLAGLHQQLEPGATVMVIDNSYVAQSNTPITRTDAEGNTYQIRTLDDGSRHEVLKNFPSEEELRTIITQFGNEIEVTWLQYYWAIKYASR